MLAAVAILPDDTVTNLNVADIVEDEPDPDVDAPTIQY